ATPNGEIPRHGAVLDEQPAAGNGDAAAQPAGGPAGEGRVAGDGTVADGQQAARRQHAAARAAGCGGIVADGQFGQGEVLVGVRDAAGGAAGDRQPRRGDGQRA